MFLWLLKNVRFIVKKPKHNFAINLLYINGLYKSQ